MSINIASFIVSIGLAVAAHAQPPIKPLHLYNGVNRPVIVDIESPRSFGTITLALMDSSGAPLAEKVEVHPGRVDLAQAMPAIWKLRETGYVQLMNLDEPVGPPLVLQPMLSRLVPQTEPALRPDGVTKYSRIVGWRDENAPPPQTPPPPPPAATETPATTTETEANDGNEQQAATAPAEEPSIERLFTGLRIYVDHDVVLHTTHGDIRLAMRPDHAPNTVWNFLELARGGYYRDVAFHRIVPLTQNGQPFVIQAGDPTATGDGGPGYWLPIENSRLPHEFGVISMARSDDPDSNGSQIFICLSREGTARLDGQYCSFGYAVEGGDAIRAIAQVELADVAAGRPARPPLIKSAELVEAPARVPGRGRPDARVSALPPAATRPRHVPR